MSGYLLDTNVASERRKGQRMNPGVGAWFETVEDGELFLSVLVLGEIRKGIERARCTDQPKALALERWLVGFFCFRRRGVTRRSIPGSRGK